MNKHQVASISAALAVSLLVSGCQTKTGYQKIEDAPSAEMLSGNIQPLINEVNIACLGTYHCEIVQIDRTEVISTETNEPYDIRMITAIADVQNKGTAEREVRTHAEVDVAPLTSQSDVKIVPLSASLMSGFTTYYARVKPGKHEIQVNFYPENNTKYVERFAMIHDFMQPGTYKLRAFRLKPSPEAGTLLETASPEPLCVELSYNNRVQRRFCKQVDDERQGEFVEASVL